MAHRATAWVLAAGTSVALVAGCTSAPAESVRPASSPAWTSTAPTTGAASPSASSPQPSASADAQQPTSRPTSPTARPSATATLVASAQWLTRSGVRALRVVPTAAGREPGTDPALVWQQVLALRPDADTPGMRDQLACHVAFAPAKAAWYLEPARPDVGYAATVAAGCNPGGIRDAG